MRGETGGEAVAFGEGDHGIDSTGVEIDDGDGEPSLEHGEGVYARTAAEFERGPFAGGEGGEGLGDAPGDHSGGVAAGGGEDVGEAGRAGGLAGGVAVVRLGMSESRWKLRGPVSCGYQCTEP